MKQKKNDVVQKANDFFSMGRLQSTAISRSFQAIFLSVLWTLTPMTPAYLFSAVLDVAVTGTTTMTARAPLLSLPLTFDTLVGVIRKPYRTRQPSIIGLATGTTMWANLSSRQKVASEHRCVFLLESIPEISVCRGAKSSPKQFTSLKSCSEQRPTAHYMLRSTAKLSPHCIEDDDE